MNLHLVLNYHSFDVQRFLLSPWIFAFNKTQAVLFSFMKWFLFEQATNSIFVMINDGLQISHDVLL